MRKCRGSAQGPTANKFSNELTGTVSGEPVRALARSLARGLLVALGRPRCTRLLSYWLADWLAMKVDKPGRARARASLARTMRADGL